MQVPGQTAYFVRPNVVPVAARQQNVQAFRGTALKSWDVAISKARDCNR